MYLFYAVAKLNDSLFSSPLQGIKMTLDATLQTLTEQALTDKLEEMVSVGLGFGEPVEGNVAGIFKGIKLYSSGQDSARVGFIPEKYKSIILADKSIHVAITSGFRDIVDVVISKILAPAGISWSMSSKSPDVLYMQAVTKQILDIYNNYIYGKEPGASFTCAIEPVASKNAGFSLSIIYKVTCDKSTAVIHYSAVNLLTDTVQDVSDKQIDAMASGMVSILKAVDIGKDPFEKDFSQELVAKKLDMSRVVLRTMRAKGTIGDNDCGKLFDEYMLILKNTSSLFVNQNSSNYLKRWNTLNEFEQNYIKAICNLCLVLHKACLASNVAVAKQNTPAA